jgi:PKD repeat protein
LWDFGDGSTSTQRNPIHTYTEVGLFTVSLTISEGGASNTRTITDYINVIQPPDPPEADFTSDVTTGEDPLVVNFTDLSTNDAVSWYWEFGDGSWSTLQNPNYIYYVPGVYTVSLTSTGIGGTSDTETKVDYIVVTATTPVPDFNGIPTYGIAPLTVNFTDLSDGYIETWHWDFGDGNTSDEQHPEHTFMDADDYTITLTVTGPEGTETLTKEDFIDVRDILSLTVSAASEQVCLGESTQLFAEASGGTETYTFNWTSEPAGFVSDEQNPIVTPDETTVYIVELNDGEETIEGEVEIIVHALPEITLGEWPENLCNEDEPPVQLTAEPMGGVYSGNSVSEEGLFTPEEAATGWNVITYTYEDENGCVNSAQDSIYIDQCVGLNKVNEKLESVLVFPNPNAGIFTVESIREDILKIEVYDQNSKLVFSNNSKAKSVRISLDLTPGIYYLRTFVNSTNDDMNIITKEILIKE